MEIARDVYQKEYLAKNKITTYMVLEAFTKTCSEAWGDSVCFLSKCF